jgi:hypothetical protein
MRFGRGFYPWFSEKVGVLLFMVQWIPLNIALSFVISSFPST